MLLQSALLIIGFALLIKGADIFVSASVGIAERLNVSKIIIGLTIVAMGTAAPEIVIAVTASIRGSNALAIGNVVGSNSFNLMMIIGLCAIIKPMAVKVNEISKDFWISIIAATLLLVLKFLSGDFIPRAGSLLLLVIFAIYMFFLIRKALKSKAESDDELPKTTRKMPILIFFSILGLALIIAGGHLTVESAVYIAGAMNVSERIIGITIIAVGTSLPELLICLVACKKGENEFALGNIIGSNIINILLILGLSGIISPLDIGGGFIFDTFFLIAGSLITLVFVYTNKRIARAEGFFMVLLYLGYMSFALFV
ncbi:MAG: calcium/sodium antiporter [Defluviitaleaceae bacterium]|nr:calcium/sodium antiporter [Defluviitaleaceae bacterium]